MATKQKLAERIAQLTRDEKGDHLSAEEQGLLVAALVKANTRDRLTDRLKALTDPVDAPPPPAAADEPGTALATTMQSQVAMLDHDRLALLRRTLAVDLTDDEFAIFAAQCNVRQLDPFANQIHAVVRQPNSDKRKMTVQTGIDGFRVIADRTGCYAGSDDPVYEGQIEYGSGSNKGVAPIRATVTVRKIVQGQVFEVTRHAYWEEYYPGDGSDGFMWRRMPHVMLSKCAEAQAMRAAFPSDLSGLYADEEMMQADALVVASTVRKTDAPEGHDVATEVERWRLGIQAAIDGAEPELIEALKVRWGKIEPTLPPLRKIDNMRDMRRAVAVAKSTLRVREIHPADVLPPADDAEPQPSGAPGPVQDRDEREDTIDVPSTERTDVPSPEGEPSETGGDEAPTPPASTEPTGETTATGAPVSDGTPLSVEDVARDEEPLVCAAGDGGFDEGTFPIFSEDGKPYHVNCAPML